MLVPGAFAFTTQSSFESGRVDLFDRFHRPWRRAPPMSARTPSNDVVNDHAHGIFVFLGVHLSGFAFSCDLRLTPVRFNVGLARLGRLTEVSCGIRSANIL